MLKQSHITKTSNSTKGKVKKINYESKVIAKYLTIDDLIEKMWEVEASVKYHKEGFPHKLLFRLINPSKSGIRK